MPTDQTIEDLFRKLWIHLTWMPGDRRPVAEAILEALANRLHDQKDSECVPCLFPETHGEDDGCRGLRQRCIGAKP